jgi:hypothetical protein
LYALEVAKAELEIDRRQVTLHQFDLGGHVGGPDTFR